MVTELDGTFFSSPWWSSLEDFDLRSLPAIDPSTRIAPCLENPTTLVFTEIGSPGRSLAIAGDLAGATDTIEAGPALLVRGGIAGIVGFPGPAGEPSIGGLCAFLLAAPFSAAVGAPVTGNGLSLGPIVLRPDAGLPTTVQIQTGSADAVSTVDDAAVRETILASCRSYRLLPGAIVMVALGESLPADADAILEFGALGRQSRSIETH